MSKAFTRDDDDAGFLPPPSRQKGPARLTAYGARVLREQLTHAEEASAARIRALLDDAEIVAPAGGEVAALGARVRLRGERGAREVVLVSADEVGYVPHGVGVATPLARAIVGARAGDVVSIDSPRDGEEELEVLAVEWPPA